MPQGKTKNQHFVPVCLLKHFVDSNGVVYSYDSKRDIMRPPTTVNRILSENYFYDKDNSVENFLRDNVEAPAAPIIESIASNPWGFRMDKKIALLRFISVQLMRTPSALEQTIDFMQKFTGTMIERLGELNNFNKETIDSIRVKFTDQKSILALKTIGGALHWPLLDDLSFHILINQTSEPFFVSDHPVTYYNFYLKDCREISYTSIAARGVQIFMPISKSVTICLYDSSIYKIGEKNSSASLINNLNDVKILNELQIRNRKSFIIFSSEELGDIVRNRCNQLYASSLHTSSAWSSKPENNGQGKLKSTHAVWLNQAKISPWLSFSRIHRRHRKRPAFFEERNPDLVTEFNKFMNNINKRKR